MRFFHSLLSAFCLILCNSGYGMEKDGQAHTLVRQGTWQAHSTDEENGGDQDILSLEEEREARRLAQLKRLNHLKQKAVRIRWQPWEKAYYKDLRTLSYVTHLDVEGNPIGDRGACIFAGLAGLTFLNMRATRITDKGVRVLGRRLQKLQVLKIGKNWVTSLGARHLLGLKNLQHLDLQRTYLKDEGLNWLVHGLPQLRKIKIKGSRVSQQGMLVLQRATNLTSLNLDSLSITPGWLDGGACWTQPLGHLTQLIKLSMGGTLSMPCQPAALDALSTLEGLRELRLSENRLTDGDLLFLKSFTQLEALDLSHNCLTRTALLYLTCALPLLRFLNLSHNDLAEEDMEVLSKFPTLLGLNVGGMNLRDLAASHIGKVSTLRQLIVSQNKITGSGISELLEVLEHLIYLDGRDNWVRPCSKATLEEAELINCCGEKIELKL